MSWITKPAVQAGQEAALAGREMCAQLQWATYGYFWALAPHSWKEAAFHFWDCSHPPASLLSSLSSASWLLLTVFSSLCQLAPSEEKVPCWPPWVEISKGFNFKGLIWDLQNSKHALEVTTTSCNPKKEWLTLSIGGCCGTTGMCGFLWIYAKDVCV